ncbi:hypothetical protein KKE60_06295 [Patescibacteria group bacterium]|nr:hypothetical protein [Patescibacteria group bacterium]
MEKRIILCAHCAYVGFDSEVKRYSVDHLDDVLIKRGLKKAWGNLNGAYYIGCPKCQWPIFIMKRSGVDIPDITPEITIIQKDEQNNETASHFLDNTKKTLTKRLPVVFTGKCDMCGRTFESKIEKSTRCANCVNIVMGE